MQRSWSSLVKQLKQEVESPQRIHSITSATLPQKYVGFKGALAFQLNDGTIYLVEDVIRTHEEDKQDVLNHELAHRVLKHKQRTEEGELEDMLVKDIIKKMPTSLRHEVDVNLLLHKTFGPVSAEDFAGEIGGWATTYNTTGNIPLGDIFTVVRKVVLDNPDVPPEWKAAVVVLRRKGAAKFADYYGYDTEYADRILDYGTEPKGLDPLIKHVWYGMVSPKQKSKTRTKVAKRKRTVRSESPPTSLGGVL